MRRPVWLSPLWSWPARSASAPSSSFRRARRWSVPVWLWVAIVLVHAWLVFLALKGPGYPIGDVAIVYPGWIREGIETGRWVGIQVPWVYPVLALVPILVPWVLGPSAYVIGFLLLACLTDTAALAVLLGRAPTPSRIGVGWVWTLFLLLLGPVAIARIDVVATALALAGMVTVARRPRVASALLTLGAWIKVWPAALVAAVVVIDRRRIRIVVVAAALSVGIVLVDLLLGGNSLSFLDQQSGRGLQIESTFATPFLLAASTGGWSVYFDQGLVTYELRGPGVATVASVTTPLVVVLVVGILVLAGIGVRRRIDTGRLLPWTVLALVATLIAVNKVGSPQFVGWLAVPTVLGLLAFGSGLRRGFGIPTLGILVVAAFTHLVYPDLYDHLVSLDPGVLGILTLRNAVELALCVGAIMALARLVLAPLELGDRAGSAGSLTADPRPDPEGAGS